MASIDNIEKSGRLIQGRRYTHDTLTDAQEAFTSTLDINVGDVYRDAGLIPSSGLPFSGSSQSGSIYSVGNQGILKYYYRHKLTKSDLNTEAWFFLDPTGSDSGIGAQLIDGNQKTNFISPKYSIPSLANANAEDSTPGYLARVFVSTSSIAPSALDAVSVNNYAFDYKTGVLQFSSSAVAPAAGRYVYMSTYQYVGRTMSTFETGSFTGSFTGQFQGSITSASFATTASYAVTASYVIGGVGSGTPGTSGTSGTSGQSGSSGTSGSSGSTGTSGTSGSSGSSGTSGTSGSSGSSGTSGQSGSSGTGFNTVNNAGLYRVLFSDGTTNAATASSNLTISASTLTMTGDATVTGRLTAQEFYTEYISSSVLYESGSTKFGDSSDDLHQFTGSLSVTGSMVVRGTQTITGSVIVSSSLSVRGEFITPTVGTLPASPTTGSLAVYQDDLWIYI